MKYVNKRMVIVINQLVVELSGGIKTVKNNIRSGQSLSFIENIYTNSLFGQPIYPSIYHQAGAYMFYIIKNHLFNDGNKRTGLAAAITFLEWNGKHFPEFDENKVFDFVMSIAEGKNDPRSVIPKIAIWFEDLISY